MPAKLMVAPGSAAELRRRKTDDRAWLPGKAEAKKQLAELIEELSLLHNRLYAEGRRSLLLILRRRENGCASDSRTPRRRGSFAAPTSTIALAGTSSWGPTTT